jgi:hypothetical protein
MELIRDKLVNLSSGDLRPGSGDLRIQRSSLHLSQPRLGLINGGLGSLHPCSGYGHVHLARPRLKESQLRLGSPQCDLCASDRQLGIGGIEPNQ